MILHVDRTIDDIDLTYDLKLDELGLTLAEALLIEEAKPGRYRYHAEAPARPRQTDHRAQVADPRWCVCGESWPCSHEAGEWLGRTSPR